VRSERPRQGRREASRGPGHLIVDGHRLDAPGGSVRLSDDGAVRFVGSYLIFAAPGCWEVSAQIENRADSKLTFVTKVVKIDDGPGWRFDP
jgi:hypothetical protein